VITANVQRRHLTTEQKKELAIRLIRDRPNDSDRKIALLIGVSNKTISSYRNELQEQLEKFVKAWRSLDVAQRREFVQTYQDELHQASTV
jgi:predicted translin family RNA/ssDNA-binding protein